MTPENKLNPTAAGTPANAPAPAPAAPAANKPLNAHFVNESADGKEDSTQELKATPKPIEPAAPLPGSIGSVSSGTPLGDTEAPVVAPAFPSEPATPTAPAAAPEAPAAPETPVASMTPEAAPSMPTEPAAPSAPMMGAVDVSLPSDPSPAPAANGAQVAGEQPTAAPGPSPVDFQEQATATLDPEMTSPEVTPDVPSDPMASMPGAGDALAPQIPSANAAPGTTPDAFAAPNGQATGDPSIMPIGAPMAPGATPATDTGVVSAAGDKVKQVKKGKGGKTRIILIVVVLILVLAAAAVGIFALTSGNFSSESDTDTTAEAPSEPTPEPEPEPETMAMQLSCSYDASAEELPSFGDDVTAFRQEYTADFGDDGNLTQIANVSYITYTTSEGATERLTTLQRSYSDYMVNTLGLAADPFSSTYVIAADNNLQAIVTHTATSEQLAAENAVFFDLGISETTTDGTTDVNTGTVSEDTLGYVHTLAEVQAIYEAGGYTCSSAELVQTQAE